MSVRCIKIIEKKNRKLTALFFFFLFFFYISESIKFCSEIDLHPFSSMTNSLLKFL